MSSTVYPLTFFFLLNIQYHTTLYWFIACLLLPKNKYHKTRYFVCFFFSAWFSEWTWESFVKWMTSFSPDQTLSSSRTACLNHLQSQSVHPVHGLTAHQILNICWITYEEIRVLIFKWVGLLVLPYQMLSGRLFSGGFLLLIQPTGMLVTWLLLVHSLTLHKLLLKKLLGWKRPTEI